MTRERDTKSLKPHSAFARVLSLLLLGFIVYGTTVEAAHSHGSVSAATSITGAFSFSDPATETQARTNLLGCGDCLICQLHQSFSTTVISVPPSIGPLTVGSSCFNSKTVSVLSQINTPRRGRAPPLSL